MISLVNKPCEVNGGNGGERFWLRIENIEGFMGCIDDFFVEEQPTCKKWIKVGPERRSTERISRRQDA